MGATTSISLTARSSSLTVLSVGRARRHGFELTHRSAVPSLFAMLPGLSCSSRFAGSDFRTASSTPLAQAGGPSTEGTCPMRLAHSPGSIRARCRVCQVPLMGTVAARGGGTGRLARTTRDGTQGADFGSAPPPPWQQARAMEPNVVVRCWVLVCRGVVVQHP